jgi:5'-nucleotidase
MRILICNDDGYFAPGIEALASILSDLGEITVFAPERDRSGASNSLTLSRPLTIRTAANGFRFVDGTPTDCVHIAVTGLLPERPDLVVSGINDGANMATTLSIPERWRRQWKATCWVCRRSRSPWSTRATRTWKARPASPAASSSVISPIRGPAPMLLNVNIPNLPYDQLGPPEVTRLGKRHHAEPVIPARNPRGETVYWIGPAGASRDNGPGTDFHAVASGRVSISPLHIDLTATKDLDVTRQWLIR